jgi:hypothetical protein
MVDNPRYSSGQLAAIRREFDQGASPSLANLRYSESGQKSSIFVQTGLLSDRIDAQLSLQIIRWKTRQQMQIKDKPCPDMHTTIVDHLNFFSCII